MKNIEAFTGKNYIIVAKFQLLKVNTFTIFDEFIQWLHSNCEMPDEFMNSNSADPFISYSSICLYLMIFNKVYSPFL